MNCSGEPFTHICEWKKTFPLLWLFGLILLDLGSGNSGTRIRINDLLPFAILLVGFWLRVGTCI